MHHRGSLVFGDGGLEHWTGTETSRGGRHGGVRVSVMIVWAGQY